MRILREIELGKPFRAPDNVTFGYQEARKSFSYWFEDSFTDDQYEYIVLGTGHTCEHKLKLMQTIVLPDGFHSFHLYRIIPPLMR